MDRKEARVIVSGMRKRYRPKLTDEQLIEAVLLLARGFQQGVNEIAIPIETLCLLLDLVTEQQERSSTPMLGDDEVW